MPGGTLARGASVDVQFLLGVVQGGSYRFFIVVEQLPPPSASANAPKTGATKGARATKQ